MGLSNIQRARRADGSFPPLAGGDGTDDQVVTAPPEGLPETQAVDWEKRFHDTEAAYTRERQAAVENARQVAELQQHKQLIDNLQSDDPELVRQAAEVLGISYEEPNQGADPSAELRREIDDMKAWRQQQEQQAGQQQQLQADVEHIGKGLLDLQQQLGRELTDKEQRLLGNAAWAARGDDGLPDVTSAIADYAASLEAAARPRARPRAPHVMTGGKAGTDAPNMADPEQRLAWQMQRLADLNSPS